MPRSNRSRVLCGSWFVAAALCVANETPADVVDLSPVKDNTLIEGPVGNSNGTGNGIFAGRIARFSESRRRALLAFDLASIPAGATIDAVTLTLYLTRAPNGALGTFTLHRVNAEWGEAGSFDHGGRGDVAELGDATWTHRFHDTTLWATAGGDFVASPSASQTVGYEEAPFTWGSTATMVDDVQFWHLNPASNFGWLVKGDEVETGSARKFSSREGPVMPLLTISYTPNPTDVHAEPIPASVSFAPPWPVPATGRVNLSYTLPRAARVSLAIHDAAGRVVRRLTSGADEPAGRRDMVWDGRTDDGTAAAPGFYVVTLVVDGAVYPQRVPIVR